MRVLVLIIYSEDLPSYLRNRDGWRLYSKKNPSFDVYFMKFSKDQQSVTIEGDMIYIPGEESLRNLSYKFITSLENIPFKSYNFILRTNISSFYVFHNLLPVLESLPKERLLAGEVNGNYVSGAGMIFSPDVCELLVQNKDAVVNYDFADPFDDVIISFYLHKTHGIEYTQTYPIRVNIELPQNGTESTIPMNAFHFRLKQGTPEERMQEYDIMMNLYKKFYC